MGTPYLISFSGMSAVLRKAPAPPLPPRIVALSDRARVLDQWSRDLACRAPIRERVFPFASVRTFRSDQPNLENKIPGLTIFKTIPWNVTLIRWYIYLGLFTHEVGWPSDVY
jgi:hypothetical protein